MEAIEVAIGYHAATKHHFHAYARSLGYLDWATQPDPFRRYAGAPLFLLPFPQADDLPPYDRLFRAGAVETQPVTLDTLAGFFENSLAISAWKEFRGERWSLRCNPSSGNLHPTEGYAVVGAVEGLHDRPAVYHYAPREHGLERRADFDPETWRAMTEGFPAGTFLAGLSSIHWREAWKYGERAYRYCQQDVGHALGACVIAASLFGWRCRLLDGLGDVDIARLLGLDRAPDSGDAEREQPDLLLAVMPAPADGPVPRTLPEEPITRIADGAWRGQANRLSADHVDWRIIDITADACEKPRTTVDPTPIEPPPPPPALVRPTSARRIIQQRRSAVAMDGESELARDLFYGMLERLMPRPGRIPWEAWPLPPSVHLGLFVHRVRDLRPGLYALVRRPEALRPLRVAIRSEFLWEKPPECPEGLPLYTLHYMDCQGTAIEVSCGQDIAGDGAFSLGMLADFEGSLHEFGPWHYRRLFWEAGMIGQVLYLEAEAAGLRATGMGCYFDDPVHKVFGLERLAYQSMYHFAVGGPLEDARLTTRPPYSAERRALAGGVPAE